MGESFKDIKSAPAYHKAFAQERAENPNLLKSEAAATGELAKLLNPKTATTMGAYTGRLFLISKFGTPGKLIASGIDLATGVPDIVKGVVFPTKQNRAIAYIEAIDLATDYNPVSTHIRS